MAKDQLGKPHLLGHRQSGETGPGCLERKNGEKKWEGVKNEIGKRKYVSLQNSQNGLGKRGARAQTGLPLFGMPAK